MCVLGASGGGCGPGLGEGNGRASSRTAEQVLRARHAGWMDVEDDAVEFITLSRPSARRRWAAAVLKFMGLEYGP